MAPALDWLYRRLGVSYLLIHLAFDAVSVALVCLGTLGLFSLYQSMTTSEFWEIALVAEACVLAAFAWTAVRAALASRPLIAWLRAGRPASGAVQAWHTAVRLPREFVARGGGPPFVLVSVLIAVYIPLRLDLPWYSTAIVFAAALVAIAYAAILSFFAGEAFYRPLLRDAARHLPPEFAVPPAGVPLRWKLLGGLPLINVITGVVVSGLSQTGSSSLDDLGLDVVVAVGVAFTISFELTLLLSKSILDPVRDLVSATDRVRRGDLDARVPVLSGDELGMLASSFNAMVAGLQERERLRAAFGSYVDPEVAERVLAEGELLEGEEVEATVMFVDVRGFTAFAERATAREAVARLNAFFDLVVPIVTRHGGHANKFIGDGLLAVFGAPERSSDHADRAIAAGCEIVHEVERQFGSTVRIGVGINSGVVVAGSIGGGGRLEFTVIGDAVNVAARVERATRELGDTMLVTGATRALMQGPQDSLEPRGAIPLRGLSEPVALFSPRWEAHTLRETANRARKYSSAGAEQPRITT